MNTFPIRLSSTHFRLVLVPPTYRDINIKLPWIGSLHSRPQVEGKWKNECTIKTPPSPFTHARTHTHIHKHIRHSHTRMYTCICTHFDEVWGLVRILHHPVVDLGTSYKSPMHVCPELLFSVPRYSEDLHNPISSHVRVTNPLRTCVHSYSSWPGTSYKPPHSTLI